MPTRIVLLALSVLTLTCSEAAADLFVYELPQEETEWVAARHSNLLCEKGAFDFNDLVWNDVFSIDDPLDELGTPNGEIPAGFIPESVSLQSDVGGGGVPRGLDGMVGIPAHIVGNNFVAANFQVDAFSMFITDPTIEAVEFEAELIQVAPPDMWAFVYAQDGAVLGSFAISAGKRYGVIETGGDSIARITLFDFEDGHEGIVSARFHSNFHPGGCWITDRQDGGDNGNKLPRRYRENDGRGR